MAGLLLILLLLALLVILGIRRRDQRPSPQQAAVQRALRQKGQAQGPTPSEPSSTAIKLGNHVGLWVLTEAHPADKPRSLAEACAAVESSQVAYLGSAHVRFYKGPESL